MPLLNETNLRKPDFEDGVRVTLSDGQDWTIPKPRFVFYPRFDSDGNVTVGARVRFRDDIDFEVENFVGSNDPYAEIRYRFEVMFKLLRSNYDLSDENLSDLLAVNLSDPVSAANWRRIDRILCGMPIEADEPASQPAEASQLATIAAEAVASA